jgi:DnaJ-class molecular chaperone
MTRLIEIRREYQPCGRCGGSGRVPIYEEPGFTTTLMNCLRTCDQCGGTGRIVVAETETWR